MSDLSNEPDDVARARLERFAYKLHTLVNKEATQSGCAGALLGYAIGLMRRQGAVEDEVKTLFAQSLVGVYALPMTNSNPPSDPSEPS